jgi:hypothetical protein
MTVFVLIERHELRARFILAMMLADEPAPAPAHAYYQRLLAGDQSEAWDLIARHPSEHRASASMTRS